MGFVQTEEALLCGGAACEGLRDEWALLQYSADAADSDARGQQRPLPRPQIGGTVASFVVGEGVEVKDWIRCIISGEGSSPDTYNVQVGSQDVHDVPVLGLRKLEAANGSSKHYVVGEAAEIFGWTRCTVTGRSTTTATYDVFVRAPGGGRTVSDVPAARLRKLQGAHWLHVGDPAVPSRVPGQDGGGICEGAEGCAKFHDRCVARERAEAARNCGSRCDIVFVGDSLLERLLGRMCYSGGKPFPEHAQVFQELVAASHPRSLVAAGSSDETPQTLHMLDEVLPVLKAPRLFFLLIGTNNLPKGGSANALRGIRAVLRKIREEHPTARVLIHALLPREDDGERHLFQDHIDEVNHELADLAHGAHAAGAPVSLVDCTAPLHPRNLSTEHFEDRLHLSPAGYRVWLTCVVPLLDSALALQPVKPT